MMRCAIKSDQGLEFTVAFAPLPFSSRESDGMSPWDEFGLDHNETRSWHGWYRHVSLVMLAFAMMAAIRHHANAAPPPKTTRRTRSGTRR